MSELVRPKFIECDPDTITEQNVKLYETIVGKTLFPAQPERLFIDVLSYRECLLRQAIQLAAEQNLVSYARDAALDQLGHNVGVARLGAQPSACTVRVTLPSAAEYSVSVPAGLLLETSDCLFNFVTSEPCFFTVGSLSADCKAECTKAGTDANGYLPDSLRLANAASGVLSATNVTVTANGTDDEDDDTYRERIPLALEAFSCAGPALAYKYWAMSAHDSIIDVSVVSPEAGVVNIYPLTASGAPDSALIEIVQEAVNSEKRRPLTDMVQVLAPAELDFRIRASVTLYGGADRDSVESLINAALAKYQSAVRLKMGKDIVPSQIAAAMHVEGVYQIELLEPELITVNSHSYAVLTGWDLERWSVVYD